MAWGKKKSGRKEPSFGLAASLADLRVSPQDRVRVAEDRPKRAAKPKAAPSPRRPKRSGTARVWAKRAAYWSAVLALWGAIAAIGLVIYVGVHLPPIQSLEIPKRPPTIQIVGLDGSVLATRGEMAGTMSR